MACCQRVLTGSASIRAQVFIKILDMHGEKKKLIPAEDGVFRDTRSLEQRQHLRPYIRMSLVVRCFSPWLQPQKEGNSWHRSFSRHTEMGVYEKANDSNTGFGVVSGTETVRPYSTILKLFSN